MHDSVLFYLYFLVCLYISKFKPRENGLEKGENKIQQQQHKKQRGEPYRELLSLRAIHQVDEKERTSING